MTDKPKGKKRLTEREYQDEQIKKYRASRQLHPSAPGWGAYDMPDKYNDPSHPDYDDMGK